MLAQLGVAFDVVVAAVTEHEDASTDPRTMVAHNAALKADTTVFLDGCALNKPRDLAEARAMLRRLSGRTHTVFTGLALRRGCDGLRVDRGVASEVTFQTIDEATIETYLQHVHTLDKAGGYAIQERADLIIAGFTGSFTNIVGLPLETTKQLLTDCGHLP